MLPAWFIWRCEDSGLAHPNAAGPLLRGIGPIPIRQSQRRIAGRLAEDAFEVVDVRAMPAQEMCGGMAASIPGGRRVPSRVP